MRVIGFEPSRVIVFITEIKGHRDGIKSILGQNVEMFEFSDGITIMFNPNVITKQFKKFRNIEIHGKFIIVNSSSPGKLTSLTDNQLRRLLGELTTMCDKHIEQKIRESLKG